MIDPLPVLIVGAGPVGLSLALALIQQDRPCIVFERRPELPDDPRATTLQPPVIERLKEWSILDQVLMHSRVVREIEYWDWKKKSKIAGFQLSELNDDTPTPYRLHCPQSVLCAHLLHAIEALAPGTIRFSHTVQSASQNDSRSEVLVSVQPPEGPVLEFKGSFLAAADGVGSPVRRALNIPYEGRGTTHSFFTCEGTAEFDEHLRTQVSPPLAPASYLFTKSGWVLYMRMRDSVRLLYEIPHGQDLRESMSDDAIRRRTLELVDENVMKHLTHRAVYRVQPRVAVSYREGRVFLVGDAAHIAFPIGGTAMCTGILDAYHLAESIAQGTEAALEDYAHSRRQDALHHLVADSQASYRSLDAHNPLTRFTRNQFLAHAADRPERARAHLRQISMLASITP